MNLVKLEYEIKKAYDNKDFKKALEKIYLYLSEKDSGVYGTLMLFYINCLINTGKIEEAYKCINITRKNWPYLYSDKDLVELYIICDKTKDSETILNKRSNDKKLYYNSARAYMLNGYYYSSKYWFRYLMTITDDNELIEKSKKFINEIDNHLKNKTFIQTSYIRYKSYGNKLKPGHVIYFHNNMKTSDEKVNRRPYLVWKVENGKVYCFPITTKIKTESLNYILKKERYPNYGFDRMVKDKLLCFYEKNVEKIIDEINPYDFYRIMCNMYESYCYKKEADNFGFVYEYASNLEIKKDDIIIIYDVENKKRNYYAVDSASEGVYTAYKIEKMEDKFYVMCDNVYTFTNKDFIIKTYKSITDDEKYQMVKRKKINYE